MSIATRFQDNLLASTNLDPKLVPGLSTTDVGPVNTGLSLEKIAQNVDVNLPPDKADSSHARPSMFANISRFAESVRTAWNAVAPGGPGLDSLDPSTSQDFAEWQGMVAAVALRHIYAGAGLNLSVQPLTLQSGDHAQKCVLMEMAKYGDLRPAITFGPNGDPLKGELYYICQNGTPFAIFHPDVGLCAMKQYAPSLFDGVLPWYHAEEDCHKGWQLDLKLDDICLRRLAWWAGQNGMIPYKTYVGGLIKDPALVVNPALVAPAMALLPNAGNIDAKWPGKGTSFGTAMMLYLDGADKPRGVPKLFLDNMVIACTGGNENKLVYKSKTGDQGVAFTSGPSGYAPVIPFREDAAELLEACTFGAIRFDAQQKADMLESVTVEVEICTNTGEVFTIAKKYGGGKLRLGVLPYLMIWPYLPALTDSAYWTKYYATWRESMTDMEPLKRSDGKCLAMVDGLGFRFEASAVNHPVSRHTKAQEPWDVYTKSQPFRYAMLTSGADGDLGMVFMPTASKTATTSVHGVKLSVDFGTTSTVCALQHANLAGGAITPLPFDDYSETVTFEDEGAKKLVDTQHWLGDLPSGPWNKKIFSVAQLFNRPGGPDTSMLPTPGSQEYYTDGRLFLVSGPALTDYASAAATSSPLRDQKIINDMKFSLSTAGTAPYENYHAASLYLAGLYSYAVLYLLKNNLVPDDAGNFIELYASYPNDVTRNALSTNWSNAQAVLNGMMAPAFTSGIPAIQYYHEATATTARYRFTPAFPLLAGADPLISMDIGGGTTDISITRVPVPGTPTDMRKVSIRYAGREIMVETIIEYFRRFAPGASFDRVSAFHNLCGTTPATSQLREQFLNICAAADTQPALLALTENESVQMYIEMLLSEGLQMAPVGAGSTTNWLRQMITLKFLMDLRIAARAMRTNLDMWKHSVTGTFSPVLQVNLAVSGTSAQMLQYVFNTTMASLTDLGKIGAVGGTMGACMDLLNDIFFDEVKADLPDGVKTDLHIFVDQNVHEKREVSYGMLVPAISTLTFTGMGAAPLTDAEMKKCTAAAATAISTYSDSNFQDYLGQLLGYQKRYEDIFFAGMPKFHYGLGPDVNMASDLLAKDLQTTEYLYAQNQTQTRRAAYMALPEHDAYRDLLTGMYLVDEIINVRMSNHQ